MQGKVFKNKMYILFFLRTLQISSKKSITNAKKIQRPETIRSP